MHTGDHVEKYCFVAENLLYPTVFATVVVSDKINGSYFFRRGSLTSIVCKISFMVSKSVLPVVETMWKICSGKLALSNH